MGSGVQLVNVVFIMVAVTLLTCYLLWNFKFSIISRSVIFFLTFSFSFIDAYDIVNLIYIPGYVRVSYHDYGTNLIPTVIVQKTFISWRKSMKISSFCPLIDVYLHTARDALYPIYHLLNAFSLSG